MDVVHDAVLSMQLVFIERSGELNVIKVDQQSMCITYYIIRVVLEFHIVVVL